MADEFRPLAVITGASTGSGFELAKECAQKGEIDPFFVITHRATLEEGPDLYEIFRDKEDGCIKVVMKP